MKCVISFVVLFAFAVGFGSFGAEVLPKNCVEVQILKLLAKWQKGDISSSLPSLEVIRLQSADSVFEGFGIKITYTTGDMQLAGVNSFIVEEMAVNAKHLNASATIHFPLLTLTSDNYNLKGRAYVMYSLKGSGFMKVIFRNVKVKAGTKLISNGTAMHVDSVDLGFSVRSIQVNLENSSWPINEVLNSSGLMIVEYYRREIVTAAKDMLKQIFNEYLATMTASQLLDIANKDYCSTSLQSTLALS